MADIVAYDADTHEMTLTEAATDRIATMEVPVWGKPFVVCVDRRPIYGGAFWVAYSSQSFDGVVIDALRAAMGLPLRIDLGYPGSDFFAGEDPRSDRRILDALQDAGKRK